MKSVLPSRQFDYFVPQGGLDLVTPPLQLAPGMARSAENFECAIDGGYRRIQGYERFANWYSTDDIETIYTMTVYRASGTTAGVLVHGMVIKGVTSGAYGIYINDSQTSTGNNQNLNVSIAEDPGNTVIKLCNVKGAFIVGEQIVKYDGSPLVFAGTTVVQLRNDLVLVTDEATRIRVEHGWRMVASAPQGVKLFGLTELNGKAVAFTYSEDFTQFLYPGTNPLKYVFVSSPTQDPLEEIDSTGNMSKNWAGPGTIISYSGAEPFPTIPDRTRLISYNFGGATSSKKVYGVSGVGKAFSWDGATLSAISTGMTVDKPTHIAAHKNRLFLAFGASLQFSAAGDPTSWTPVLGAGEIATGDPITALVPFIGADNNSSVLMVFTESKTFVLYGDATSNFNLVLVDPNFGAQPDTVQVIGNQVFFFNDFGVVTLSTTQAFGNFSGASITHRVQPFVQARRRRATCSAINRTKNQYRIFFDDGSGLYITLRDGKVVGVMPVRFPMAVRSIVSYFDASGREMTLFYGSRSLWTASYPYASTYVYRLDVGSSFDGELIDAHVLLAFNPQKSPRVRKAYRRCVLEFQMDSGSATFQAGTDVDYSNADVIPSPSSQIVNPNDNPVSSWDAGTLWDVAYVDGYNANQVSLQMDGAGDSFSVRIAQSTNAARPYTLSGVMADYFVRRAKR